MAGATQTDIDVTAPNGNGSGDLRVPARHHRPRRRSRWRILAIVVAVLLVLVATGAGGVALYVRNVTQQLDSNIERFGDPFKELPAAERPAVEVPAADAQNILLLGSDSLVDAGDPSQWSFGAQRTDAIMILHIPSDRSGGYIVSIPRDSWVNIPGRKNKAKINAAFSYGGPTLMVRTVEKVTGVRIDHVVVIDFEGFSTITDSLGGVPISVDGGEPQVMNGQEALDYVRERKHLPNGDFDRVKRQQNWIRAVAGKMLTADVVRSPRKLTKALDALTKTVATDDGFTIGEMRGLALSLKKVRSDDITFLTVPVAGTGWSPDGKQAIVLLDEKADEPLFTAIRKDKIGEYLQTHEADILGDDVH